MARPPSSSAPTLPPSVSAFYAIELSKYCEILSPLSFRFSFFSLDLELCVRKIRHIGRNVERNWLKCYKLMAAFLLIQRPRLQNRLNLAPAKETGNSERERDGRPRIETGAVSLSPDDRSLSTRHHCAIFDYMTPREVR
jgi:hypothetical protein